MPQYGSGGSGWAALAAALQGLGQGFQIKRDLDDRDREKARQVASDKLARDQYERQLQMMTNQEERETARVFADLLKNAPAGNRVTGLIQGAPEQYRPGLEALAEHQPTQTIPARDPRVFNFPPSVIDEAVGTPAPGDVVGQALSAQPAGATPMSPLPPPTQVPEQWNATGTAATQLNRERETRLREAQAAAADLKAAQAEWTRERAGLERQKIQAQAQLSLMLEQGRNDRQSMALAQSAQQFLQGLDVRIQQGNANLQAKQQALRLAADRAAKSGSDPMSLYFLSQMGGQAPEPTAPRELEPLPQLTMPAGAAPPRGRRGQGSASPE